MAVLSTTTASPRSFWQGVVPTSYTNIYTAPSLNSNVTSPSSTAYVKEIILCNTTSAAVSVTLKINNNILLYVSVPAYDTKVLTGLNTMLNAGDVIAITAGSSIAICAFISGVEVQ